MGFGGNTNFGGKKLIWREEKLGVFKSIVFSTFLFILSISKTQSSSIQEYTFGTRIEYKSMNSTGFGISFTDLLHLHDANTPTNQSECLMETTPETTPETPTTTKQSIRGSSFSIEEDKLLISGWLNIGQDPITGNEQRRETFWKRVAVYFDTHKKFASERTQVSLASRWTAIQKAVTKFCGCWAQIEGLHQSGVNEADKLEQARILYKEDTKKAFTMDHCWNILKYEPKWVRIFEMSRQKGKKTPNSRHSTPDSVNLDEGMSQGSFVNVEERPPGRKAEKARLCKRKAVSEGEGEMKKIMLDIKEVKMKMHEEKMDLGRIQLAQEDKKIQQMEVKLAREKLKDEERILTLDTSGMPPHLQAWYEVRKNEILEKDGIL